MCVYLLGKGEVGFLFLFLISFFKQRSCFVDTDCIFFTRYICDLEAPGMGLASFLFTGPEYPDAWLFFQKLLPPSEASHLTRYQSAALTDPNTTYLGHHLYCL